jgi:clan AA aspartic protease
MGTIHEQITLKNAGDAIRVKDGHMQEKDVRQATVHALVDTGAGTLIITEAVREQLGLDVVGLRRASLANGGKESCKITETVEVCWKNRSMTCRPWVLPHSEEVLLGAIPLEDMDLIVNPAKGELVGAHGDEVMCLVM